MPHHKTISAKIHWCKGKVISSSLRFHDQTFSFLRSNVFVSTIKRFHFYDQTFALYRHKVSNPTIKRFYSFDETFPFLYGKHYVVKRDLHF